MVSGLRVQATVLEAGLFFPKYMVGKHVTPVVVVITMCSLMLIMHPSFST